MSDPRARWLTPEEAADALQLSAYTIKQQCRAGDIHGAKKFGGRWRIPPSAVTPPPAPETTVPLIAPRNRRSAAQQRRTA